MSHPKMTAVLLLVLAVYAPLTSQGSSRRDMSQAAQVPSHTYTPETSDTSETAPLQSLTLEDAWRIALSNNLSLQQQETLLRQAGEELSIQKAGLLPSLSTIATYSYTSEVATFRVPISLPGIPPIEIEAGTKNRYDVAAQIDQPLFTGFRTLNLVKSASEQFRAQSAQKDIVSNQILLQVGLLYYQMQLDYLQQRVLEQAIQRADHHLEKARSFYAAEQATAFDTLEVANRELQLQSQLEELQDLHPILVSKLVHLLNLEYTPDVPEMSLENADLTLRDLSEYQIVAAANRPELKQIEFAQRGQSFRVKALKSAYFPQLYASASYHRARPGVNYFRDEWMDYYTVGLNLRWQLWNWKQDQRQVEKARLDCERLDLQSQQLLLDVRQQVTEAFQQLQAVKQQIELQRRLVTQERERYRITKENYEQGYATSLDLSTAENTLTSAELTLKQDYVEWLQYRLQLQFATGKIGKESPGI
ncbi:MAG: TolC family protein [Candidatus Eisenbacteria bacterium]|nr:TolC family protein [Candidatus Eisenbacteria bacterium]